MQNISPEQIHKRYSSLAKPLQDAVFSTKTDDAVSKTCVLRDVEKLTIAKLTGRVLLGYLRPESFAAEIQKETGISEMTAQLVTHDIDGEIFSNVRLELKKLYPPVIQTPNIQRPGFGQNQQPTNGLVYTDEFYQEIEKIGDEEHRKDFERREREGMNRVYEDKEQTINEGKSFKGSWKILGGLSIMAIIGFLMLVGGKIGGGLINILFWGGLAAWYYKRKCR